MGTTEPLDRAEAAHDWVTRARNARVVENMGLVGAVVKKLRGRGMISDADDMIQFGYFGLIDAAERFDSGRGLRFSTYATALIRNAIFDGIGDTSARIRVCRGVMSGVNRVIRRAREAGGDPVGEGAFEDAAVEMGISAKKRETLLDAFAVLHADRDGDGVPLEELSRPGGGPTAEEAAIDAEYRERLAAALPRLPERQREVISLRYGLDGSAPRSYDAIASLVRSDRKNVGLAERRAVVRLRAAVDRGA